MKVYQEKQEMVNTGIKITNYEILQEKAKDGLGSFAATFVAQARKGLVERHNRTYFFAF